MEGTPGKPSPVVDTRVIYCGDNLEQLRKLPEACVDLNYIDPPFNSSATNNLFVEATLGSPLGGRKPAATRRGEESAAQITAFQET